MREKSLTYISSFALVNPFLCATLPTFYKATPVKSTIAPFNTLLEAYVVSPPTAHTIATIVICTSPVAIPPLCAGRSHTRVRGAEIWGTFQVNKISGWGWITAFTIGVNTVRDNFKLAIIAVSRAHFNGVVIFLEEFVGDIAVLRCLLPACHHLTATGHTVTLALLLGIIYNKLEKSKHRRVSSIFDSSWRNFADTYK